MSLIVLYLCPEHPDQVLFKEDTRKEDTRVLKMIIAERPVTCPRCKKAYYKWECQTRNQNEG